MFCVFHDSAPKAALQRLPARGRIIAIIMVPLLDAAAAASLQLAARLGARVAVAHTQHGSLTSFNQCGEMCV